MNALVFISKNGKIWDVDDIMGELMAAPDQQYMYCNGLEVIAVYGKRPTYYTWNPKGKWEPLQALSLKLLDGKLLDGLCAIGRADLVDFCYLATKASKKIRRGKGDLPVPACPGMSWRELYFHAMANVV